jgi:NADH-quinone oxidoreductase subunit C
MDTEELLNLICTLEPETQRSTKPSDLPTVEVSANHLLALMRQIKNNKQLAFDMLILYTAVDWIKQDVIELIYQLFSARYHYKLRVLVTVPRDNPVVPTLAPLWRIAEWQEREVYDMFGVLYDNHPDLRRLLLEDEWQGFPLRKDYQDDFMLEPPATVEEEG